MTSPVSPRQAWNDMGRAPGWHRMMQAKLRREWPVLAKALDALSPAPAPVTRPDLDALLVQQVAAAIFDTRDDDSDLREWGDEVDGEERERYECNARAALTILSPALAAERARADQAAAHLAAVEELVTDALLMGTRLDSVKADVMRALQPYAAPTAEQGED